MSVIVCIRFSMITILLGVSLTELSMALLDKSSHLMLSDILGPVSKIFTYALVVYVMIANLLSGIQSSGILFNFFFILSICQSLTVASVARFGPKASQTSNTELLYIEYTIILVLFILNFKADPPPIDSKTDTRSTCNASFPSRMTFTYFDSIIWQGWKNPLTVECLPKLDIREKCMEIYPRWQKNWSRLFSRHQHNKKKISILYPLITTFGLPFLATAFLQLIIVLLQQMFPKVLSLLISFTNSDESLWKGYLYMILLVGINMMVTIINSQHFKDQQLIGIRIQSAISCALFKKSFQLTSQSRKEMSMGETVNLMSIDTQKISDVIINLNLLWSGPLTVVLSLYFLWGYLGPSALAGLVVMILIIPVNTWIGSEIKKYQTLIMKNKDSRMKTMNEVVDGMKVLKLYAWEPSFAQQISDIRQDEDQELKKMARHSATQNFIFNSTPFFAALASFASFVLSSPDNILDAKTAFVSVTFFNLIRQPLNQLPNFITQIISAQVSLNRLNSYLNAQELNSDNVTHFDNKDGIAVRIMKGNFSWGQESGTVLSNINLSVIKGDLIAIVGHVGSGKSSLLSTMIGDMEKTGLDTKVNLVGKISYVPQHAWMQNASLQNNVTFGNIFKEDKYKKILEACALTHDLDMLPNRDQTEIGEKGINLSGGQKQRVSMARAVYNDSDIYLLDDPLSAVDAHVGQHLFEKVIGEEGLLKNKTRILVTHSVKYLPKVDKIYVLKNGEISEEGSYKELLEEGKEFANFLTHYIKEEENKVLGKDIETLSLVKFDLERKLWSSKGMDKEYNRRSSRHSLNAGCKMAPKDKDFQPTTEDSSPSDSDNLEEIKMDKLEASDERQYNQNELAPLIPNKKDDTSNTQKNHVCDKVCDKTITFKGLRGKGDLMTSEAVETKSVNKKVYYTYFKTVGQKIILLIFVLNILTQGLSIGTNIWLSKWSDDSGAATEQMRDLYLSIYGLLGSMSALVTCLAVLVTAIGGLTASSVLHNQMVTSVLRAPISFFDTTPKGRVINRFAKDVDCIDRSIPLTFNALLKLGMNVIGTVAIISSTNSIFLVVLIPLTALYWLLQRFYVRTSRQLRRLQSSTRSPIYSWFGETVAGLSTIKAYGATDRFFHDFQDKVDINQSCTKPNILCNRWLAIRLEMLGNLIVLFAALFAILGRDSLSPGVVGLSLCYAMQVTTTMNFLIRQIGQIESNMVSVERVLEYQTDLPQEAAWKTKHEPSSNWPNRGEVIFKSVETRYRDGLDLVLKDLNLHIPAGKKVGVVGRTGAGKTSLTLSLFRIMEFVSGWIEIDGVDIRSIGLGTLRSNLTIIPQDPVLFSGTLRHNLDPFGEKSDMDLWRALELAHLSEYVRTLTQGLDYSVSEGGGNLSVGQRQLVCLARALLRKTRILVLDEATAAIDLETDDCIQATIRKEFSENTIITIAHRINTIMDSDKIVLLSDGRIVEEGSPNSLMRTPGSKFAEMAREAGIKAPTKNLLDLADDNVLEAPPVP